MTRVARPAGLAGVLAVALIAAISGPTRADSLPNIDIAIKDHRFQPPVLTVPANRKFQLTVHNRDATKEEFESYDLNTEKVIAGGASVPIIIGPLRPGRYSFIGEFHSDTAKGTLIAK